MPSRHRRLLKVVLSALSLAVLLLSLSGASVYAQDIRTSITVFDNLAHSRTLTMGINSAASDAVDPGLGESYLPPSIPGLFDARLIDADLRMPPLLAFGVHLDLRGIYASPPFMQQFEISVRRAFGASATYFTWGLPLAAGITGARIRSYPDASVLDVDMTGQTQILLPAGVNRYIVTIAYAGPALQRYKLTTDIAPQGRGNVLVAPLQNDYAAGSLVTLTALNLPAPDTCFVFSHWSGAANGTNPVIQLTMDTHKQVTANYVRRQFPVTVSTLDTFHVQTSPPAPQKLFITNSGLACYDWTATPSTPWLVLSKTSGRGDDSIIVSVLTSAIPCQGTHIGTVTLASNASYPRNITVPVVVNVGRSDVTATVLGAPVLLSCETKAQDAIVVTLYNEAVSPLVFPDAPVPGQGFILKNPTLFPLTLQGRDSARVYFEFVPDQSQRGLITDNIILSSSSCGRQAFFKLSGTRIAPTVTADVLELDFGNINACVSDPLPSRTVVLRNAHSQAAQLRYTVPTGFTLTSAPASVPANSSVDVTLQPARTGMPDINESLGIEADFGVCSENFAVALHGKRQTASFTVESVAAPGTLPPQVFDSTCVGSYSASKGVRINNTGTADLQFTLSAIAPFEIDGFSPTFLLKAGESRVVDLRFHPVSAGVFAQPLSIDADVCGLTASVLLQGATYDQQILQAVVTPPLLSLTNCEISATLGLAVTNTGTQPAVFATLPALPAGFSWDPSITLPVVIAPGAGTPFLTQISFTPPQGQNGTFGGSVAWYGEPCGTTVYFTLAGERVVPSTAVTPRALDFGQIVNCGPATTPVTRTVMFTNASPLPVLMLADAPAGKYRLQLGGADFPSQGTMVAANSTQDFTVTALPGNGGRYTDSLVISVFAGASNACSETKVISLTGERYQPAFALRVKANEPEFDKVCLGTTAVRVWQVVNTGDKRVTITSNGFDALSPFSLPSTPFSVTLDPGRIADIPIRFRPTLAGTVFTPVTFTQDACPGEITLTIQGTAIEPRFAVTSLLPPDEITLFTCEPSQSRQIRATITNTGNDPIVIADGSIPPVGFSYDPAGQFPFTLAASESRDVVVRFNPPAPGSYGGLIRIKAEPCGNEATFSVSGRLLNSDYAVAPEEVDFGVITVCASGTIREADLEKLSREVTVRNTGEVPLSIETEIKSTGSTPDVLIITPANSPFQLNPGVIQAIVTALATPIDSSIDRIKAALQVTIRRPDSACAPEVVTVPFTARIQRLKYEFLQDSVSSLVNCAAEPVTLFATLHNQGNTATTFRFSLEGSSSFALKDSLIELTLEPGQIRDIPVVYTPDSSIAAVVTLVARDLLCGGDAHVHLSITVKRSSIRLACNKNAGISPQSQVRPGDKFIVPIYLNEDVACGSAPLELSFTVAYDVYNLAPVAFQLSSGFATLRQIEPGMLEVTISGDGYRAGEVGLLVMEVLVGKEKTYPYKIQDPDISPDVGGVLLDQSCSGTLLVRPRLGVSTWRELGISQIDAPRPNLLSGSGEGTTIDFSLERDAHVELTLHDRLGNRVATIYAGAMTQGPHSIDYVPGDLPSGLYLVALNTGTEFLTQKLLIAR